jgi:glycosyltransferase involved in cell wall biosynthesis
MIYADQRWIGNHGIGRFARHVLEGLNYRPVPLTSDPAAALDTWSLARALQGATSKDLFFSPGYNTPLFGSAHFMFTIHDLSHVYCPENSSALIRLYYATVLKRACHRAARILTVSEFTRGQIARWSGVSESKIVNVGCGVDPAYHPDGETYGLPFSYLLSVSNRKRHKNEFRMVESFARAGLDPRIHLVFTGACTDRLTDWIEHNQVTSRIDFLGPVAERRLPSLYRGALALVFTSLYEGFGLPLLEAMACGTPVVTSNVTAMPEVAGGAAMVVDPTCVDEISHAIERVAVDPLTRAELRQKGLERAAAFSWETTCRKVHQLLGSA